MKLYSHQQQLLDENPKIHGLWWSCGTGKSLTAIKLIEQNVTSCLIICPKSLKTNWYREITKWSDRNLDWLVVTKEEFRRDFAELILDKRMGLIIDEAHNVFGHKSKLHKNTLKYLKAVQPKCLYLLTATPKLASPYSVMAMQRILGQKVDWRKFTQEFFCQIKMGRRMIWQPRKDRDTELQHIIKSSGSVKRLEDCIDLPDAIYEREDFTLNAAQRKALKELDDDITTAAPIVKWSKTFQICNGTLKKDEKNKALYWPETISRVSRYLESEKKIALICRHNAELHMYQDALEKDGHWAKIINGKVKNRQEIIDEFESRDQGALLINASVSEGFNLRGVNTMIFHSLSFSLVDRVQMEGRIRGSGRGVEGRSSVYVDFVVPGTIDEDVYNCIQRKQDFLIEMYSPS